MSGSAPSGNIVIRRAGSDDLPTIIHLAQRIWRAHYPGIISTEQIEFMLSSMYSPKRIAAEITELSVTYLLAEHERTAIGFAAAGPADEAKTTKLHKLYVLPEHQGNGVGRALMNAALTAARAMGRDRLILAVNKGNQKAIAAYAKWGFRQRDAVKVEIGGGFVMDDYILEIAVPDTKEG